MLEQYGRRNNIYISSIPDSVERKSLEEKVVSLVSNIGVDVTCNYIEACHRLAKSQNNSKKQLFDLLTEDLPKKFSTT